MIKIIIAPRSDDLFKVGLIFQTTTHEISNMSLIKKLKSKLTKY